jgi:hypothetical protein
MMSEMKVVKMGMREKKTKYEIPAARNGISFSR